PADDRRVDRAPAVPGIEHRPARRGARRVPGLDGRPGLAAAPGVGGRHGRLRRYRRPRAGRCRRTLGTGDSGTGRWTVRYRDDTGRGQPTRHGRAVRTTRLGRQDGLRAHPRPGSGPSGGPDAVVAPGYRDRAAGPAGRRPVGTIGGTPVKLPRPAGGTVLGDPEG